MTLKMFSIFDTKGGMFYVPFFFNATGQAIRVCIGLASDTNSIIGQHPSDFALFELGSWDDQTGAYTAVQPINLGLIASFLPNRPQVVQFPSTHDAAEQRRGEI